MRHNKSLFFIKVQYTNLGFGLLSLKSAWDLVFLGKNCDIREILRNLIGCLKDWELDWRIEGKSKPWISISRFRVFGFIYLLYFYQHLIFSLVAPFKKIEPNKIIIAIDMDPEKWYVSVFFQNVSPNNIFVLVLTK